MEINDGRSTAKSVNKKDLIKGQVYINNDMYLLATDEDVIIDLQTGIAYTLDEDFETSETFIPVKARLEIY